jgi:CRISPR-associated protein, TM1811 family
MSDKFGYVVLEVGGIQKYILSTGKLKEMIGGSELIESLSAKYLDDFAKSKQLTVLKEIRKPVDNEILPLQRNAGAMHLLFPSEAKGREFLQKFGLKLLADFPGLPIFGALEECEFTSSGIREAKFKLSNKITDQRNKYPTSTGMQLLPICAEAPLDGEPAIGKVSYGKNSSSEIISLSSNTKRIKKLLEDSRDRLRGIEPDEGVGPNLKWSDDLEEIACGSEKVAFIHIDGNDLGKRFRQELENISDQEKAEDKTGQQAPSEDRYQNAINVIKTMSALSNTVKETTTAAFKKGLSECLKHTKLTDSEGQKLVPARPLVLGGDDVTVVIRADLALYFIDAFVKEFERYSNQELGKKDPKDKLTVGVGMVVCPTGYPFLKAFDLSEELVKNSKELTAHMDNRPSSMDYIVITNDTENDLDSIRSHLFTAEDDSKLTAKPMLLSGNNLAQFVEKGISVLEKLPRSTLRNSLSVCRKGVKAAFQNYTKLKDNIERGLGGRANQNQMGATEFSELFKEGVETKGFFYKDKDDKNFKTKLGDYIELNHLLPEELKDYKEYFEIKE